MTEDDLRALVREAVTRHLDRSGGALPAPAGAASVADPGVPAPGLHASFGRYVLPREPEPRRPVRGRAGGALSPLRLLPVVRFI